MEIKVTFNEKEENILCEIAWLFFMSKEQKVSKKELEQIADIIEKRITKDLQDSKTLTLYLEYITDNIIEEPPTKDEGLVNLVEWLYDEDIHHEYCVLEAIEKKFSQYENL